MGMIGVMAWWVRGGRVCRLVVLLMASSWLKLELGLRGGLASALRHLVQQRVVYFLSPQLLIRIVVDFFRVVYKTYN